MVSQCGFDLYFPDAADISGGHKAWLEPKEGISGRFKKEVFWECKLVQPLWKTVWRFLKKLKIELPYGPAIALLGIYPKDTKILIQRDTCTLMFTAALFTIAKI